MLNIFDTKSFVLMPITDIILTGVFFFLIKTTSLDEKEISKDVFIVPFV